MTPVSQIHNPHDKFFKETMSDLTVVKSFIINYLPPEITELLDLNNIELTKGSFVDEELKETFTDMLYKTNLSQKEAYLYFLFEHKSRIHQTITLQLLKYMLNIWELVAKQNPGKLPVIIPLLIYHGRQKWNVGLKLTDLLPQIPSQVKKYVPDYEYILYDLSTYTEKDIKGEIKQRLFLEILVSIFQENFAERIKKILALADELEKKTGVAAYIETVMRYIMEVRDDLTLEKIIAIDKELSTGRSALIMTIAEQLRQEGLEKGRTEEKLKTARKLLMKGMVVDEVVELTELPKEAVQKLNGGR